MFNFFSKFGESKANDVGNSIVKMLVQWDPKTATQAEISEMDDKLTALSVQAEEARIAFKKDKDLCDAEIKTYNQYLDATNHMQASMDETSDPDKKASLGKSIATMIEKCEKMAPDIEKDKANAAESEEFFNYLTDATKSAAEKLKTAREEFSHAINDMKKAQIEKQRADDTELAVKTAAGLVTDNFGTAMGAIKSMTEDANAKASASKNRATLLRPVTVEEDANIANAMQAVKGQTQPASLADRLSALKKM